MSNPQDVSTEISENSQKIRASVLHGPKDLRVVDRLLSPPRPGEVQVSVQVTGLCGSDLHYYQDFRNGDILVKEAFSLGHESAGVVVKVGDGVTEFQAGDKVALEVGQPCGQCDLCIAGRYNICKSMVFRSSARKFPHAQGTLQDRINHPARWCHKLPKDMSFDLGALVEPLAVAIHAERRAQLRPQSKVLVFGAGAVGLLTAAVVKKAGAQAVTIADIDQARIDFALRNGFADLGYTVPMKRGNTTEENLAIAKETAGELCKLSRAGEDAIGEYDVVFECTGVAPPLQAAIFAAKPGSRVMVVGMGTPAITVPLMAASSKEVDLVGVFRYANTYPEGIKILSKSLKDGPDFSKLVTHRFVGLENAPEAFAMAGKPKGPDGAMVIKVVMETGQMKP